VNQINYTEKKKYIFKWKKKKKGVALDFFKRVMLRIKGFGKRMIRDKRVSRTFPEGTIALH